jgi:hypothetical protein
VTELGAHLSGGAAWTAVTPTGGFDTYQNCSGWTSGMYNMSGGMGCLAHATRWLSGRSASCNADGRLFCLED